MDRSREAPVVRRRVLVSGLVQGVFFRDSCRRLAVDAGLCGSVRNLADGRVEAVFEGPPGEVDRLVAWCRQGPAHALVSGVAITDEPPRGESSFRAG